MKDIGKRTTATIRDLFLAPSACHRKVRMNENFTERHLAFSPELRAVIEEFQKLHAV
jgi:hypothetical protein